MTTTIDLGRGRYQRVTDPTGATYLVQVVPSGYLSFSVHLAQGPVETLIQILGATIVNRVVFRGGWTLLAWGGAAVGPQRRGGAAGACTRSASPVRRRRRRPSTG